MRSFRSRLLGESGVSLVEVLVGTAISLMVGSVVISLLLNIITSSRSLQKQTNDFESLRIAANMFLQDARFASEVSCLSDSMVLYLDAAKSKYVKYTFASWNGTLDGQSDSRHLHRWLVEGGVMKNDDIVGWDLEKSNGTLDATWFSCSSGIPYRKARIHLVKKPLPGQTVGTHLEVVGFLR